MDLSSWLNVIVALISFSELSAKTYDGSGKGHRAFPSDIPADTTEIDLNDNDINSFPENAFNEFHNIEILKIGENPFTELPNLGPVGNTLKYLEMEECQLTELNADILNELVVLEHIRLRDCKLTSFPDVPGPGNTLSIIDLLGCDLLAFPMLSNYKALTKIDSSVMATMTTIPEEALATLQLSGELDLESSAIASLPSYPKAYENINDLDLEDTAVSFFLVPLQYNAINYEIIYYIR